MQKKILWMGMAILMASSLQLKAQYSKQDSTFKRWFVGTFYWVI
jgi:hypothetical protein